MERARIGIFLFLLSFQSFGAITVGTLNPPLKKIQIDDDGNTSSFALDPFIGYQVSMGPFWFNHKFQPELGFVYHQVDVKEEYSKFSSYLLYDFSWPIFSSFKVLYGLGNFITWMYGSGGAVVRNNGGSYSTFYKPQGSSFSFNTSTNLGLEFEASSKFSVLGKALIFDIINTKKRTFRYLVSLKYNLDSGYF